MKYALTFLALFAISLQSQVVAITIAPGSVVLYAGQSATFQATITGSPNFGSTASLSPAIGLLVTTPQGSSGNQLVYTAPDVIAAQQVVTINDVSHADVTKTTTAIITLMPGVPPVGPQLAAIYSLVLSPFPGAPPLFGVWAQVIGLPAGAGCVFAMSGTLNPPWSYSAATATVLSQPPTVLLPYGMMTGRTLADMPLVTATCDGFDALTAIATPAP